MKVFISWSGPRAEALGAFMKEWLGDVIQALKPWFSSEDIRKGQAWVTEIGTGLEKMAAALVIVTPENMHEDWLLFEAGAAFGPGHPCFTYLIDLDPSDIKGPLAALNHTRATEEDTLRMVREINDRLGDGRLKEKALDRQFETWWPKLEEKLEEIGKMSGAPAKAATRDTDEMIAENLNLTRQLAKDVALLKQPPPAFIGEPTGIKGLLSLPEGILPSSLPAEPPDLGISPETLKSLGRMIQNMKVAQEEAPEGEGPTGGKSEDGEAGGNA